MTLKDQIAKDNSIFLNTDEHGDLVQYNGVEIVAVIETGPDLEKGNVFTSEGTSSRAEAYVSVQDVPSPKSGDTILHNGVTWEVARVLQTDSGLHRLELISEESPW